MLAQPVPLPRVEGHRDGNNGLEGGITGGDGNSGIDRLAGVGAFAPWDVGGRCCADDALEGLDVCPRIVGCEARNRAVDQFGDGPCTSLLAPAPIGALHRAGSSPPQRLPWRRVHGRCQRRPGLSGPSGCFFFPGFQVALAGVLRRAPPGGSTLMTSAPWSANNIPAKGPATYCPKSITQIPSNAPAIG